MRRISILLLFLSSGTALGDGVTAYVSPDFEVEDGLGVTYVRVGSARVARLVSTALAARLYSDVAPLGAPDGKITAADAWIAQRAARGEVSLATAPTPAERLLQSSARRILYEVVPAVTWLGSDRLGSITVETDAAGAVVGRRAYTPFGAVRARSGDADRYGFTGQEADESGLLHFSFRQLDPLLGRWTSPDPLFTQVAAAAMAKLGEATTAYAYVGNDASNSVDPTGRQKQPAEKVEVSPMPKMRTQLGKPGLSTILTLGIANLNCGYYTTKSLLHYWAEKLTGSDQRVPIPGFHKLRSLAFDPSAGDGGEALQNAVDELSTAPAKFDVWKQRLESFGPLLAGGMLGRADWGRDSAGNPRGIGHNVLIVGVEGRPGQEPDRLAFKDPLSWSDEVRWDDYSNMKDRIDSLHAIRRQRASMLLPQLNPRIVVP